MKTMLITGASRGIGAATAVLAAQQGYRVVVNYRRQGDAAKAVVAQIQAHGGQAWAVQADVSEPEQIERLFATVDEYCGRLDCLVNNAGILQTQTTLANISLERLQQLFQTNVIAPMLCSQQAIQRMSTQLGGNGGNIINVSSLAAKTGSPFEYVDYAATKGALDTFTIGLAKEVAAAGIRVNAVRPGFIETDMHADGGEPSRVERLKDSIPLKRGGTADEVAAAIMWLASDQASYTTGAFIDVAGGR